MRKDERVINDMKDVDYSVQDILKIILDTIKEPKHRYTIECIDMFNTIYILQQRIDKTKEYIKENFTNEDEFIWHEDMRTIYKILLGDKE